MASFIHPLYQRFTVKRCGTPLDIQFEEGHYETEDPAEIEILRATGGVYEPGNEKVNSAKDALRDLEDHLEVETSKADDGKTVIQTTPVFTNRAGRRKAAVSLP